MLCKTKGTTVQDGRGVCLQRQGLYSIPWEKSIWGPYEAAWIWSPQNLKRSMIYFLSVILFSFYLIKTPILCCQAFLTDILKEPCMRALSLSLSNLAPPPWCRKLINSIVISVNTEKLVSLTSLKISTKMMSKRNTFILKPKAWFLPFMHYYLCSWEIHNPSRLITVFMILVYSMFSSVSENRVRSKSCL